MRIRDLPAYFSSFQPINYELRYRQKNCRIFEPMNSEQSFVYDTPIIMTIVMAYAHYAACCILYISHALISCTFFSISPSFSINFGCVHMVGFALSALYSCALTTSGHFPEIQKKKFKMQLKHNAQL